MDARTTDLLLIATMQMKDGIDQTVPILKNMSDAYPECKGVYECYKIIQEKLDEAGKLLKVMK